MSPAPKTPLSEISKSKLTVLTVIDSLLPGGAERSLLSMLPGLSEQGIDLKLVCLKESQQVNLEAEAAEAGFPPLYLAQAPSQGKWYFRLPRWAWELRQLVKKEKPDLVHSTLFQSGLACRLALLNLGVPLLSSVVNMDYSPERAQDPNIKGGVLATHIKLKTVQLINRLTAGLVTHFHAVTPAVKAETTKHLGVPPNRISVVFRGREGGRPITRGPREKIRKSLKLSPTTKLILTVGRHEYQKGQIYLIQALAEADLHEQNVHLLVAGREGTVTNALREAILELNIQQRVHLLGHRSDINELLLEADVFALPSLYEGAAGALLEAMAAEIPIVVSDLPELQGIVDSRCCVKVPTRSPKALCSAISSLLQTPELSKQLVQTARHRFEEQFLLNNVVKEMASLYRRVATTEPSSQRTKRDT